METNGELDVFGLGPPIRAFVPKFRRRLDHLLPEKIRSEIMPHYACSLSDHYLIMLEYVRKKDLAKGRNRIVEVTEGELPEDYDRGRVFYGEFVHAHDVHRFSFGGPYSIERCRLIEQMLVRSFAHRSICECVQNIKQKDPQIYFAGKLVGSIGTMIGKYARN